LRGPAAAAKPDSGTRFEEPLGIVRIPHKNVGVRIPEFETNNRRDSLDDY